jgi:Protein of unknown function (DUF3995)
VASRRLAYVASALAIASAGLSVFWTLGGTPLLDTIGGSIEVLARSRSSSALALGAATSLAKLGAAVSAVALVRPWGRYVPERVLLVANGLVSALLIGWGGANVLAGTLALTGMISPADGLDARALRWHVFVWDLWFLVWGAALALALVGWRRTNRTRSTLLESPETGPPADGRSRHGDVHWREDEPKMSVHTHSSDGRGWAASRWTRPRSKQ